MRLRQFQAFSVFSDCASFWIQYVYKNHFDDVQSVRLSYVFFPKGKDDDSYWDPDTLYNVAFEGYVPAGQYLSGYYEYDTVTNTVTLVEEGTTENSYSESTKTGRFRSWLIENQKITWIPYHGEGEWNEDHTVIRYSGAYWADPDTFEITRIQGTITFKR